MARLVGFEPTTFGVETRCSIPLSYRRVVRPEGIEPPASGFGIRRSSPLSYGRMVEGGGVEPPRPALQAGALPAELSLDDRKQGSRTLIARLKKPQLCQLS